MTTLNYIKELRARAKQIDAEMDADAEEGGFESVDDLIDSGNVDEEGIASFNIDIGRRDAFICVANELTLSLTDIPVKEYLNVYPDRREVVLEYLHENEGTDKIGYYLNERCDGINPDAMLCTYDEVDEALVELIEIDQEDIKFIEKEVERNANRT